MGKGGINRLLLCTSDLTTPTVATLLATDPRAHHIRTILSPTAASTQPLTLRIALEDSYTHDAAPTTLNPDGSVQIQLPDTERAPPPAPPPILLLLALQRPKATARILSAAASLGVTAVLFVAAEKVEKSYWDCKLFRGASPSTCAPFPTPTDVAPSRSPHLPGRPRGPDNHPERDATEQVGFANSAFTRVDGLPAVRARLLDGVQQASTDASLPQVALLRLGLRSALGEIRAVYGECEGWARLVAHPPRGEGELSGSVTRAVCAGVGYGAIIAVGPEGGWTEEEVEVLEGEGFGRVSLGERVLRSETAVVVALGLVHEGLRMWEEVRRP